MKKFGVKLLIVVIAVFPLLLSGCGTLPTAEARGPQIVTEAAVTVGTSWDTTEFLVGEFTANTGDTYRFDGRGTVTVLSPGADALVGRYSMSESYNKTASVTILLNGTETVYSYSMVGTDGYFSLTDRSGSMLFFLPVQYD